MDVPDFLLEVGTETIADDSRRFEEQMSETRIVFIIGFRGWYLSATLALSLASFPSLRGAP